MKKVYNDPKLISECIACIEPIEKREGGNIETNPRMFRQVFSKQETIEEKMGSYKKTSQR